MLARCLGWCASVEITNLQPFAFAARMIAGDRAFRSALWIGVLWPFAFHFARVADWYSTSFFLVAALTLAYLRYLERPNWQRLAWFVIAALALLVAEMIIARWGMGAGAGSLGSSSPA